MKIMEGNKQEKYVLLNDDSDVEEFDRSKSALMTSQDGKVYVGKHESQRYASWKHGPWLLHSFLILLLVASQCILGVLLLITHWDLETMRHKGAEALRHDINYSTNAEYNASSAEHLESIWGAWSQHNNGMAPLTSVGDQGLNAYLNKNISLEQRVKTLELRMQFLEVRVSSRREMMNAPGSESRGEEAKKAVDSQIKGIEGRLVNLTKAVNSLQRRLEEDLDTAFFQISHVQDEISKIKNSSNHRNSESSETSRPKATENMTPASESAPPASGSATFQSLTTQSGPPQQPKTTGRRSPINIPSIKSRQDFQVFFYGADIDANGFLKFGDIQRALGADAPRKEEVQRFDENNDHMYSYVELLKAFTVTD